MNRLRRGGTQASARASDGNRVPQELPDGTLVYTFGDSSDSRSSSSEKQRSRASEPAADPVAEPAADSSTAPNENGTAKSHAAPQPVGGHGAVAVSKDAERVGDDEASATNAVNAGLDGCTVKQLTEMCREKGLKGYSALNKAGLVQLLKNAQPVGSEDGALPQSEADETDWSDLDEDFDIETFPDLPCLTVKQLKSVCRQRGMKGYSGLRKQALVELLSNERKYGAW